MSEEDVSDAESYGSEDQYLNPDEDAGDLIEGFDGGIHRNLDKESQSMYRMMREMRDDKSFCDISFVVKGNMFYAHRVVISAWSRWLKSILIEGHADENIVLNMFEPRAFGAVLDYMYGAPFYLKVDEGIDEVLKVIRRLELAELENQCWAIMMKSLTTDNAPKLHELADRYDCAPLKLAAWRVIQQAQLGMHKDMQLPESLLETKGTGLTGPGERTFLRNLTQQEMKDREFLSSYNQSYQEHINISAQNEEYEVNEYGEILIGEDGLPIMRERQDGDGNAGIINEDPSAIPEDIAQPEELDADANATDLVKAWAARLADVYNDCGVTNTNSGGMVDENNNPIAMSRKNIRIHNGHGILGRRIHPPSNNGKGALNKGNLDKQGRADGMPGKQEIHWNRELKDFYIAINRPDKIPFIDEILSANHGNEERMLVQLMTKYKRIIPESMMNHLDTLQGYLERFTESSFQMT